MLRPNLMHTYFFAMVSMTCLFGSAEAQSIDSLFIQAARKKLVNAKEYTLKVAALMQAENYSYKPAAEEMSFGKQLLHLSENLGWLSSSYLNGEENPVRKNETKLLQKDSIIMVVNRAYEYALRTLEQFPPNRLNEPVKFFAGPMNKLQIINLINDHQTHHRAQMIVYLRLNGIKPPAYIGW